MIRENAEKLLKELPPGVELVAAAKTRSAGEIQQVLDAGIRIIGENYIQEARDAYNALGAKAKWHLIGHLQKNKVKKAVEIFDMIETVDSAELAREIDRRCSQAGKAMPVLIEINSGREEQKNGVLPEKAGELIRELSVLKNIKIKGLMTMGPLTGGGEELRPCFAETRRVFEEIKKLGLPGVDMRYLSMGMTGSYKVAVEEGANMVRIGTLIFGERKGA